MRFVWTAKGSAIHVGPRGGDARPSTLCGRVIVGEAAAEDVLWFEVCLKCKRAVLKYREETEG